MTFDVVHVDADGVPWTTSDDPAVLMECERGPVHTEDGTWRRARLVHLRPGYILEDVVHDHNSGVPLRCRPDHYARSMDLARLLEQRRTNDLLAQFVRAAPDPDAPIADGVTGGWATIKEAAAHFRVSADTVSGWVHGKLRAAMLREGKVIRIHLPTAQAAFLPSSSLVLRDALGSPPAPAEAAPSASAPRGNRLQLARERNAALRERAGVALAKSQSQNRSSPSGDADGQP
jgi:hypothetical protein